MTYGADAADTHLTNSFWYLDSGDVLPCYPTAAQKSRQTKDSSLDGIELSTVK